MQIFLRVLQIFMKMSVMPTYSEHLCRSGYLSKVLKIWFLYCDMGHSGLDGQGRAVPKSSGDCGN